MLLRVFVLLVVVLGAAACGAEADGPGGASGTEAPAEADESAAGYRAIFSGALSDTLRGRASFGTVVASATRRERFVIVLGSRDDPLGGLVFARPDGAPPAPGTYDLVPYADSTRRPSDFSLIYREGMRRTLRATGGTLRLDIVRDTLIEGSFRADLEGTVAHPGQLPRQSLADVRGAFRAENGSVGFLLGL